MIRRPIADCWLTFLCLVLLPSALLSGCAPGMQKPEEGPKASVSEVLKVGAESTTFTHIYAALKITKTHNGDFTQGQIGATYTIIVDNIGTGATIGAVTVTDNLHPGLFATAISGTGWSCNLGTLTCMRSDVVAPGASYPAITLTVNIAEQWPLNILPVSVINTATVSGGGSANNIASDVATVNRRQHSVAAIPTMTEWGMFIFMALAGVRSFYFLIRRK